MLKWHLILTIHTKTGGSQCTSHRRVTIFIFLHGPPVTLSGRADVARYTTERAEAPLKREDADVCAAVRAVEQVAAQTGAAVRLLRLLLDDGRGTARFGTAGTHAVTAAVNAARCRQEGGAALDGGHGADDALLRRVKVTHTLITGVLSALIRVILLQLLTELLQQLLHTGQLGLKVGNLRGASYYCADEEEKQKAQLVMEESAEHHIRDK